MHASLLYNMQSKDVHFIYFCLVCFKQAFAFGEQLKLSEQCQYTYVLGKSNRLQNTECTRFIFIKFFQFQFKKCTKSHHYWCSQGSIIMYIINNDSLFENLNYLYQNFILHCLVISSWVFFLCYIKYLIELRIQDKGIRPL